jgi:hypothetical protein
MKNAKRYRNPITPYFNFQDFITLSSAQDTLVSENQIQGRRSIVIQSFMRCRASPSFAASIQILYSVSTEGGERTLSEGGISLRKCSPRIGIFCLTFSIVFRLIVIRLLGARIGTTYYHDISADSWKIGEEENYEDTGCSTETCESIETAFISA